MTPLAAALLNLPMHEAIPRVLPNDWTMLRRFGDGAAYLDRSGLRVLVTTAPYPRDDGVDWMHLSCSRKDRLPSWNDMTRAKNIFCPDRRGYQVFAPAAEHINIHQFCLHIWIPLTGAYPIPDFGEGGTI